jgi:hypothetical protein
MHKYLKWTIYGIVGYTVVASFYNNGKVAGTWPNPLGNLVGFN